MMTVDELRAKSRVDPVTGCWHFLGHCSKDRTPRIFTYDHERGEQRTMSGPKAVWNIAHGRAPLPGWLVFRRCVVSDCVCPVHMAEARDKAAICLHIVRSGRRKGTALESRRANAVKARAACGLVDTPAAVVHAIRAAEPTVTNFALGLVHGIDRRVVSRIRRGESRAAA